MSPVVHHCGHIVSRRLWQDSRLGQDSSSLRTVEWASVAQGHLQLLLSATGTVCVCVCETKRLFDTNTHPYRWRREISLFLVLPNCPLCFPEAITTNQPITTLTLRICQYLIENLWQYCISLSLASQIPQSQPHHWLLTSFVAFIFHQGNCLFSRRICHYLQYSSWEQKSITVFSEFTTQTCQRSLQSTV